MIGSYHYLGLLQEPSWYLQRYTTQCNRHWPVGGNQPVACNTGWNTISYKPCLEDVCLPWIEVTSDSGEHFLTPPPETFL